MTHYDFDAPVNRRGTSSIKWEYVAPGEDIIPSSQVSHLIQQHPLLPMWVADMDFRCPQEVIQALIDRAQGGIFGYTFPGESYFEAIQGWMLERNNWQIEPSWFTITPGVVPALNMLIQTFVPRGGKVLIQPPVYHPFYHVIENQGRVVLKNPLIYENGSYRMDFDDLRVKISDPDLSLVILCSPHNPVGRVWSRDELEQFAEICLERGVLVVADEIHGDLIYDGVQFTPYALLGNEIANNSIICTAPSKTFNLAGLKTSNIIIQNPELRGKFHQTIEKLSLFGVNPFGLVATEAAYRYGGDWLHQVMAYIQVNYSTLETFLQVNMPQVKAIKPGGTYLVWLDFNALGLDNHALHDLVFNQAGVYLDDGYIFGHEGDGFQRINIACRRAILQEALERIHHVIQTQG